MRSCQSHCYTCQSACSSLYNPPSLVPIQLPTGWPELHSELLTSPAAFLVALMTMTHLHRPSRPGKSQWSEDLKEPGFCWEMKLGSKKKFVTDFWLDGSESDDMLHTQIIFVLVVLFSLLMEMLWKVRMPRVYADGREIVPSSPWDLSADFLTWSSVEMPFFGMCHCQWNPHTV